MNKIFPLSALAIACASNSVTAANDKLEEVIVTSSRVEMPLRQVATSVSVITAEEIQQRGLPSLANLLRSQPGIAVSNSGGAGKTTTLRIRGEEGSRTLLLIDGIDTSDASSPQIGPNFDNLTSAGIQRVEVLRGPQGLMYGADAGGVISVSTLAPAAGLAGSVNAEGGRYGTTQLGANLAGGNDSLDFSLSGSDFQTDGFNARTTDDVLKDDDGYENTTLHGRVGWNATEELRFELVGRDVSGESEYDGCFSNITFSNTDDCRDEFDQEAWRAVVQYDAGRFKNELSYSNNQIERAYFSEGIAGYSTEGEIEHTGYLGSFNTEALRLVYGVDLKSEALDSGSDKADRDQTGYFAEYQGSFFEQLFVTAGVRYDDNDDFGTHTSYRLSSAYLLELTDGQLKLKATYGTGFRAPSLSEIAYNKGPYAYGDAASTNLSEEESAGYDLGLSWFGDSGLYLEAVYFDQTVSDEIYFDNIGYSGYLQGSGDSDSSGVELSADYPVTASLTLTANYTFNETEDTAGNTRIRRPEHLANFGINWLTLGDALVLGLNVRTARDAEDIDGSSLDDYEVVDINASYEILAGLQIYARVENLLDEDYQEVPTYNTSGAAAYAGIRYTFKD